ncbi:MAG TPA: ROK family protein [Tahibacter sp.]|uniref:ROK family protein n=1 Tax=Tahibacter sp. TaxID=2056211 RepID=UPI002C5FF3F2|nr:ROK family protein [Tahibacter sp.]HSX62522.1 ROK family protein [Tahibacter sp.]
MVAESALREHEDELAARLPLPGHGAALLPQVVVEGYNTELRRQGRYVGDEAAKRVFFDRIETWRTTLRKTGEDPFGDTPSEELTKKMLDRTLKQGSSAAAGVIQSAIEDFARALFDVIRVFHARAWNAVSHIAVGGGFRASRVGELAIGRAQLLLQDYGIDVVLHPIRHDPDEAGLIGSAYLMPSWVLAGFDAMLAIDIGGTNVRAGLLRLPRREGEPRVAKMLLWRHGDETPTRESVVEELIAMLRKLVAYAARQKLRVAPFIGVGCPGRVRLDGRIEQGTGNLPGNWQARRFHLPTLLVQGLPRVGDHATCVMLHNDAVVQGLSALPDMADATRWAVLTIGTGLGNAQFLNRTDE